MIERSSGSNLMASVGINCFYCAVVLGKAFAGHEIAAMLAAAVTSILLFTVSIHRQVGAPTMAMSIESFGRNILKGDKPLSVAIATGGLTVVAAAVYSAFALTQEDVFIAVAVGIRMGIFIMVLTQMWRLRVAGRVVAGGTWVAADLYMYWRLGEPGISFPMLTLAAGVVSGWLLLNARDWLQERLSLS